MYSDVFMMALHYQNSWSTAVSLDVYTWKRIESDDFSLRWKFSSGFWENVFVQKVDLFPFSKTCYSFSDISALDIIFKQFKIKIIVKCLHWRKKKSVSSKKICHYLMFLVYHHSVWFHHFLVIWEAKPQKAHFVFLYMVSWQKNNIRTAR